MPTTNLHPVQPVKSDHYFQRYFKLRRKAKVCLWLFLLALVVSSVTAYIFGGIILEQLIAGSELQMFLVLVMMISCLVPFYIYFDNDESAKSLKDKYHRYSGDDSYYILDNDAPGRHNNTKYHWLAFEGSTSDFKDSLYQGYREELDGVELNVDDAYIGVDEDFYKSIQSYTGFKSYITSSGKRITIPHDLPQFSNSNIRVYIKNDKSGMYDVYTLPESGKSDHLGMVEELPTLVAHTQGTATTKDGV